MGAISGVRPDQAAGVKARRGRGRAAWAAGTAAAAAVLMFCYLRIAGDTQVNSDGAGLALQAWDMLHGNVLLHGWWMTDVSFYTTELPEYLLVTAAGGLRPEVVHICSALTYTMIVLLAAFVARGRARGPEGVARALIAAVVILAPQPTGPTLILLGNPDHVGTGVPVLILLLILDWARPRWWVPVAAAALLGWSIIGDPLIEVVGVAPLFAACLLRAGWTAWSRREQGAGQPLWRRLWPAAWYELSLAAAAVAAVLLAMAGNRLIKSLGGYTVAKPSYRVQSLHEMVHGLRIAGESVLVLFGADYKDVSGGGNVAFALVHLIGVAVVLAGFAVAAWGLLRPFAGIAVPRLRGAPAGDLVSDFLVLGIAANCAAFILEVPMGNIYAAHEIAPVLAFGAVLAGRSLGGRIVGRRAPEGQPGAAVPGDQPQAAAPGKPGARRILLPALAAVLACYAVMLGIAAAHRQAPPRNVGLAAWLAKNHLTSGFSPYWEASSITVDTGGAITVLSVDDTGWHGQVVPQKWETDVLLPKKMRPANFVILSPAEKVRRTAVIATFGEPEHSYRYGPYTILVWRKNLLPQLALAGKPPRAQAVGATPA